MTLSPCYGQENKIVGTTTGVTVRLHKGITTAPLRCLLVRDLQYNWRAKYGGMDASLIARMKELKDENRCLNKMYAEEQLKAVIVAEALTKKW